MFFLVFLAFVAPVALQGLFARQDEFLTPGQVTQWGRKGLPFVCHGGMWSDVIVFAPVMAFIISNHGAEWDEDWIMAAYVVGLVASYAMHQYVYVPLGKQIPEAHTHDGGLTNAGALHLLYMSAGIAVLGLFYLDTPALKAAEVWTVSGLLLVHFVIGTHVPLKTWIKHHPVEWYPRVTTVIDAPTAGTLGGLAVALVGLSFYALR